jgi:multisubunit Na+/H+ antiporter MnhG subunit
MFLRFLGSFGLLILPQLFARNPLKTRLKTKTVVLIFATIICRPELVAGDLRRPLTVLANRAMPASSQPKRFDHFRLGVLRYSV